MSFYTADTSQEVPELVKEYIPRVLKVIEVMLPSKRQMLSIEERVEREFETFEGSFLSFVYEMVVKLALQLTSAKSRNDDGPLISNVLSSRLLSGGLEERFFHLYSDDAKKELTWLSQVSGLENFVREPEEETNHDDGILEAVLKAGRNETVDTLV